ncbi:hypothetical protein BSKO_02667 [Bryopsis sp. KO-2023]|nr:hypothetical protein BSKO_02667 [Bryopsis sp. KO-2023]
MDILPPRLFGIGGFASSNHAALDLLQDFILPHELDCPTRTISPRRAAAASIMLGDPPESDREVVKKLQGWGRIANVLLFGVATESMVV